VRDAVEVVLVQRREPGARRASACEGGPPRVYTAIPHAKVVSRFPKGRARAPRGPETPFGLPAACRALLANQQGAVAVTRSVRCTAWGSVALSLQKERHLFY
jgi:hypothetical protein